MGIIAFNWPELKSGQTLRMKNFPIIRLMKLDNHKGCYYGYDDYYHIVDIEEYNSEVNGFYYYFQLSREDWHPLTNKLWELL